MRVFVAGATGVLGKRLVDRLSDRGHDVVGLVRDDAGEQLVEARGGTARYGDLLDPSTLDAVVDADTDVLVHAATAIPDSTKPTDAEWAHNDRVRLDGMQNLLAAAPDGLQQVVFPSVVWVARQPDGSAFDETANRHPDRATESAAAVETLLADQPTDLTTTVVRNGLFYAPDARETRTWAEQLIDRKLPIVGGGLLGRRDVPLSVVHVDDAASAACAAIDREAGGIYHIVDDEPVTGAEFFGTFADKLDAPQPLRIPGWLAQFVVGKPNAKTMTEPMVTTNEKARRELDWEPTYGSYRAGLKQVLETWADDGTLEAILGDSTTETADSATTASTAESS